MLLHLRQSTCSVTVVACVVVAVVLCAWAPAASAQKPINPNINLDQLLRNPKFLNFQKNCLVDSGPCDGIGKRMKLLIGDLLTLGTCRQCSEFERINAPKVADALRERNPEIVDQLVEKYAARIAQSGINVANIEKEFGVTVDPNVVKKYSTTAQPRAQRRRTTAARVPVVDA